MLVILLVCILPFIGYWMYWVIRMRNPYKSILYIGKKGSGKSTLITKLCLKYHKSSCIYYDDQERKWKKEPWKIYTNTKVYLPFKVHKFDIKDLGKFVPEPNSIVICDEINLVWDNRNFKSFSADIQEYFRLARKLRNKLVLFSQTFDCDKKVRSLVDEMWLLQSILGTFSYGKRITKVIDIKEAALNADSQVVDTLRFASILEPHSRQFTFIPFYIKYYDSYENMTGKPYLQRQYWPVVIPRGSIKRRKKHLKPKSDNNSSAANSSLMRSAPARPSET